MLKLIDFSIDHCCGSEWICVVSLIAGGGTYCQWLIAHKNLSRFVDTEAIHIRTIVMLAKLLK